MFLLFTLLLPTVTILGLLGYVKLNEVYKNKQFEKIKKTKHLSVIEVSSWLDGDCISFLPEDMMRKDLTTEPIIGFLVTAGTQDIVVCSDPRNINPNNCRFIKPWEFIENIDASKRKKLERIVTESETYAPDFGLPGLQYHDVIIPASRRLTSGTK